jgi:hypothetical protein
VVTSDATTEALAAMFQHAKGLALVKDEIVGWVKSMDQYRGGKGADRQHFLSFWSRQPVKVDRKNATPIIASRPCLSVAGGIQPDLLADLADAAQREDGFLDRLLWSWPLGVPDRWTEDCVQPATVQAVDDVFKRLHERPIGSEPIVVRFSPAARALWRDWYQEHTDELARPDFPRRLRGPWAKLPSQAARLAFVLHLLWEPDESELSDTTLGRALDLVAYFKTHAKRVYARLGHEKGGLVLSILAGLKERGSLTKRQIIHDLFQRNVPAERITAGLEELQTAGLVIRDKRQGSTGRPAEVWSRV